MSRAFFSALAGISSPVLEHFQMEHGEEKPAAYRNGYNAAAERTVSHRRSFTKYYSFKGGNIMEYRRFGHTMNDEFYTHIHMSAGNSQGQVFGGHLNRAVVSATCEMVVTVVFSRRP